MPGVVNAVSRGPSAGRSLSWKGRRSISTVSQHRAFGSPVFSERVVSAAAFFARGWPHSFFRTEGLVTVPPERRLLSRQSPLAYKMSWLYDVSFLLRAFLTVSFSCHEGALRPPLSPCALFFRAQCRSPPSRAPAVLLEFFLFIIGHRVRFVSVDLVLRPPFWHRGT